ncbi:jg20712 [Pararge aegeria aegeria]|uniref:Jg20712 protein n=1 Tax=Pararge aegeria aegeria TaxID=348720 RepID=A0A8S4SG46_9NEOP|nr:jg20712 [Pararge aegeria aegeria]
MDGGALAPPRICRSNLIAAFVAGSSDSEVKQLYRFQGVALPTGVILNHFAFSLLIERAKKLNSARSPINPFVDTREPAPESIAARA